MSAFETKSFASSTDFDRHPALAAELASRAALGFDFREAAPESLQFQFGFEGRKFTFTRKDRPGKAFFGFALFRASPLFTSFEFVGFVLPDDAAAGEDLESLLRRFATAA